MSSLDDDELDALMSIAGRIMREGLAGTAAMSGIQRLQRRLTGHNPRYLPASAMAELLRVRPQGRVGTRRLNALAQALFGATSGTMRGVVGLTGTDGTRAVLGTFALLVTTSYGALVLLRSTDPPWAWTGQELCTDLVHKAILAAGASVAYEALHRTERGPERRR